MKKDNLTDLVQALPPTPPPTPAPETRPQQQVVNNAGETITLGQNGKK